MEGFCKDSDNYVRTLTSWCFSAPLAISHTLSDMITTHHNVVSNAEIRGIVSMAKPSYYHKGIGGGIQKWTFIRIYNKQKHHVTKYYSFSI